MVLPAPTQTDLAAKGDPAKEEDTTDYEKRFKIVKRTRLAQGTSGGTITAYAVSRVSEYQSGMFYAWSSEIDFLFEHEAERMVELLALLELLAEANLELAIAESKVVRERTITSGAQATMEY